MAGKAKGGARYSARLTAPFLRLLQERAALPPDAAQALEKLDPDARLSGTTLHWMLEQAIEMTGNPYLGLEAAQAIEPGEYGALEYAASSASTVREAFAATARYLALINQALTFSVEVEGDRAIIRAESDLPIPRAAAEFQAAAFHLTATRWFAVERADGEVWFTYSEPDDVSKYTQVFHPYRVRFEMPYDAFVLRRDFLDEPLPHADPDLHRLIRSHADHLLCELPPDHSVTRQVREHIIRNLAGGHVTSAAVAQRLHVSPRTLVRNLAQEGTSFKILLDDIRHRLALRYIGTSDLALSEVAFLLGFSEPAPFHRAFKRWTGRTPLEYRRACRR